MATNPHPFALSLSKGFDRLSPNGTQRWPAGVNRQR